MRHHQRARVRQRSTVTGTGRALGASYPQQRQFWRTSKAVDSTWDFLSPVIDTRKGPHTRIGPGYEGLPRVYARFSTGARAIRRLS
jgi:hypothetical protein